MNSAMVMSSTGFLSRLGACLPTKPETDRDAHGACSLSWRDDPEPQRRGARAGPGRLPQLAEHGRDVVAHGLLGKDESLGDLGVGQPVREELEYLDLAGGEPGRVGAARRARAARHRQAAGAPDAQYRMAHRRSAQLAEKLQ